MTSPRNTKKRRQDKKRARAANAAAADRSGLRAARQALLVLGMHRSGTSALTRVFSLLGADLPKSLMGSGRGNEAGHWESIDLMLIHDDLLSSAGSHWDDWRAFNPGWSESRVAEGFKQRLLATLQSDYDQSALFVVKDPRICRFVPVWRDVLERFGAQPGIIIPVRNPIEVAASLKARDGFLPAKSYLLWLRHVIEAERVTRDLPRAVITYDQLMNDWRRVAARVAGETKLRWPRRSDHVDLEIDRFVSVGLRHHTVDPAELGARSDIIDWVKAAYGVLREMAEGRDDTVRRAELDRIRSEFDKASAAFGLVLAEEAERIGETQREVARLSDELGAARHESAEREAARGQERERLGAALQEAQARAAQAADEAARLSGEIATAQAAAQERGQDAARLANELDGARQELALREQRVGELASALQAAGGETAAARAELEAANAAISGARQAAARLSGELDAARSAVQEREQEIARLARELNGARQFLRDSQTEVQRLAGELDAARNEVAQSRGELAGAREESECRQRRIDALAGELQAAAAESERSKGEVEASRQTLAESERRTNDILAELQTSRSEVEALRAQLEAARDDGRLKLDELVRAQAAAADAEREAARLAEALAAAQAAGQERAQEAARLAHELEVAQQALSATQAELVRAADEIIVVSAELLQRGQALADARAASEDRQRRIETLSVDMDSQIAATGRAEGEARRLAAEVEAARGERARTEAALAEARAESEERQRRIMAVSADLESEKAAAARAYAEVARLADELSRSGQALADARAASEDRQRRIEALSADLDLQIAGTGRAEGEARRLAAEVDAARGERARTEAALVEARAESEERQRRIMAVPADLESEKAAAARAYTEVARLADELSRTGQALADTRAGSEQRQRQIDALAADLQSEKAVAAHAQGETTRLGQELFAAQRDASERGARAASLECDLAAARALLDDLRSTLDEQARLLEADREPVRVNGSGGWRSFVRRLWSAEERARAARKWEYDALRRSRLFEATWYLGRYADVAAGGEDPLWNYLLKGSAEGRDPHPLFDGQWYPSQAPDLASSGLSALGHYVTLGAGKGLDPHPLFDTDWYLDQNPDVAKARVNPLYHFWKIGASRGLDPHPLFDTSWYLEQNPDVSRAEDNALFHYLTHGWKEGRDPHPEFDTDWYLEQNADVLENQLNPLVQYLTNADWKNVNPSRQFDGARYLDEHPELISKRVCPLVHYVVNLVSEEGQAAIVPPEFKFEAAVAKSGTVVRSRPDIDEIMSWQVSLETDAPTDIRIDGEIGIFIHLFYEDLAEEIGLMLRDFPFSFRVYVSTDNNTKKTIIEKCFYDLGLSNNYEIRIFPNAGLDIGPFMVGFANEVRKHEICLRLHGKKSTHNSPEFGERWRAHLLSELLGDRERINYAVSQLRGHPELGILMARHWPPIGNWINIGENYEDMKSLLARINVNIESDQNIEFPSGSMYWFRGAALQPLFDLGLSWNDFSKSRGEHRNATIAHAIERSILYFSACAGYHWAFLPARKSAADLTLDECYELVRSSDLFDAEYYSAKNPDVGLSGVDPLKHYLEFGYRESRDPSPNFDTSFYSRIISRSIERPVNPLVHYILEGKAKKIPVVRPNSVPASILVDDLYAAYKPKQKQPDYVQESFPVVRNSGVKLLAFYLPQFHPFEENDRFWGRGFTEWTNTTKALPLFGGHYQPRLPGELGFYDTRLKEVIARQIELAKQYGIYGFCLHHYFFGGKPIMRAPYNHILANRDLDIPFCLHWANEPWTARWDGLTTRGGVLLDQRHSPDDDRAFFRDIEQALKDPRYIKVDGRPLLIIYRPSLFPNILETVERWREECRKIGLGELFLAVMQTGFEGEVDPRKYGFDAAIEYPPHNLEMTNVSHRVKLFDRAFDGQIFDYQEAIKGALARLQPDYTLFRGIVPGWDCTARRANPDVLINSSPDLYRSWLEQLCQYEERALPEGQRFIFINAWNEWAEGAYLEPDQRYGYAYLSATAQALNGYHRQDVLKTYPKVAIGVHLFYVELLDEFISYFSNILQPFDLYVTTSEVDTVSIRQKIISALGGKVETVVVRHVENVGRDMGSFVLSFLPLVQSYDLCCWVHSKKTVYNAAYGSWRKYLLDNLLGVESDVSAIIDLFKSNEKLGVAYPKPFPLIADKMQWGSNFNLASQLLKKIGIDLNEDVPPVFPSGAMFWFRPVALQGLMDLQLTLDDFSWYSHGVKDESGTVVIDGTISHALERIILYVAEASGYECREFLNIGYSDKGNGNPTGAS